MADNQQDLYAILGLNKNATDDEIKKAYKKLAKKYHPDLNRDKSEEDKKAAEAQMKKINVAYDILKDPDKRARYDQFGFAAFQQGGGGAGGKGGFGDFDINDINDIFGGAGGFGFGDIFDQFFGAGGRHSARKAGPADGADLRYDLNLNFEDAAFGKKMKIKIPRMEICKDCNGTGAAPGYTPETCPDCHGTGMRQTATRTPFGVIANARPCEKCHGSGTIIKNPCGHCHGGGKIRVERDIELIIPKCSLL